MDGAQNRIMNLFTARQFNTATSAKKFAFQSPDPPANADSDIRVLDGGMQVSNLHQDATSTHHNTQGIHKITQNKNKLVVRCNKFV